MLSNLVYGGMSPQQMEGFFATRLQDTVPVCGWDKKYQQ